MSRGRTFFFLIDGHGGGEGQWDNPPRNTTLYFGCKRGEYMSLDKEVEGGILERTVTQRTAAARAMQKQNISETPNETRNNYEIMFDPLSQDPKQGVYNMYINHEGNLVKINKLITSNQDNEKHSTIENVDSELRRMLEITPNDKVKYYLIMCRGDNDPFDNFSNMISTMVGDSTEEEINTSQNTDNIGGDDFEDFEFLYDLLEIDATERVPRHYKVTLQNLKRSRSLPKYEVEHNDNPSLKRTRTIGGKRRRKNPTLKKLVKWGKPRRKTRGKKGRTHKKSYRRNRR